MDYEKEFLEGKLAVNCRAENQCEKFKKWVKSLDKNIDTGTNDEWEYEENTCYCYDKTFVTLAYDNKEYYKHNNYKVVTYKQLMYELHHQEYKRKIKKLQGECKLSNNTRISQEEKQEYTFAEVVSRIKEGEEYICTNSGYNIQSIKRDEEGVYFEFDHFGNSKHGNTAGIPDDTRFVLKPEHEYMNFEDAAMSGKRFKYKDMDDFKTLKEIVLSLKKYWVDEDIANMLNEKAWEVEE